MGVVRPAAKARRAGIPPRPTPGRPARYRPARGRGRAGGLVQIKSGRHILRPATRTSRTLPRNASARIQRRQRGGIVSTSLLPGRRHTNRTGRTRTRGISSVLRIGITGRMERTHEMETTGGRRSRVGTTGNPVMISHIQLRRPLATRTIRPARMETSVPCRIKDTTRQSSEETA